jgi:hypothetical protein
MATTTLTLMAAVRSHGASVVGRSGGPGGILRRASAGNGPLYCQRGVRMIAMGSNGHCTSQVLLRLWQDSGKARCGVDNGLAGFREAPLRRGYLNILTIRDSGQLHRL